MDNEPIMSYEVLEESFERVFDAIDSGIANSPELKNKDIFVDVSLVDKVSYQGKQHVNIRERDEDVYEIKTPRKFSRRLFLFKSSPEERLADKIADELQNEIGEAIPYEITSYHISPAPRTNIVDVPHRGDVFISVHTRNQGWPITSFLVHQGGDIAEQCKRILNFIH